MKKSIFNNRPNLFEYEGEVVRINFDTEQVQERVIDMNGDDSGETRDVYKAYVIRLKHPLTIDAIESALEAEGFENAGQKAAEITLKGVESGDMYADALSVAKRMLTAKIDAYDKSSDVNLFYFDGVPMWLDKNTRNGLLMRLNAEKTTGKDTTTLWFGTQSFVLGVDEGIQMLYALEVYASECYDKTAEHKTIIESMESVDEIVGYDYTKGYPEKLTFNAE